MENVYRAAIYCRLSQEDRNKYNDVDESESIQNQKAMLLKYVNQKKWKLYDIYFDDDYSGMDAKRPAWNRLLKDAESKKFDIIVCKTQSRFTRDMEMVERYLNYKFHLWGIRFITIVDNVDTNIKGSKKARQINGLVNQWYVEDTSESIKSALQIMREQGKYIASTPLYGYLRDEKDKSKLVIDPVASEVVKRIFDMYYYEDIGSGTIADILNNEGVLPPAKYKKEKLIPTYNHYNMTDFWKDDAVRKILKNRVYTGDMVQGTTTKTDIKCKNTIKVPKEKWIIVENTHEAIISKELFMYVQEKFENKKVYGSRKNVSHLFSGKLKCQNCGSTMQRRKCHGVTPYYRCRHSFRQTKQCSNEYRIQYDNLYNIVLYKIKEKIDKYCDFEKVESKLKENTYIAKINKLNKQKDKLEENILKKRKYLTRMYEDMVDNIIDKEEYMLLKETYNKEILESKNKVAEIDLLIERFKDMNDYENKVKDMISKYKNIEVLDKETLNAFIDIIKIGAISKNKDEKQTIEIYWKF